MFQRKKVNTVLGEATQAVNGCNIALVKAPNGTLWAAYVDNDGAAVSDLYVAYSTTGGSTWTEELALSNGRLASPTVSGGKTLALMIDSNSVPHIIFLGLNAADTWVGRIRYFNRVGGTWGTVETIASADANASISALSACIDSTNTFHLIARGDFTTLALYYWTGTTGSWSTAQSVDSGGLDGDITVTSANAPICIYADAGGEKYNTRSGGTWANEETISTYAAGLYGRKLVIDSSNNIHVVWNEIFGTGGYVGIKYRKRTSGVWGTEQIVVNGDTNNVDSYGYPLLGIDDHDIVYVVYQYDEATVAAETVWYKQIISEVVGAEATLDSLATQPNAYPSPYAYLWHRFPSSGILKTAESPCCLLLDETGTDADVYYLGSTGSSEGSGVLAVVGDTLHYVGKSGTEYVIKGTVAT